MPMIHLLYDTKNLEDQHIAMKSANERQLMYSPEIQFCETAIALIVVEKPGTITHVDGYLLDHYIGYMHGSTVMIPACTEECCT